MIRYKMFEKEITPGNHVSQHFCVDKFGGNFNPKSKHYKIDEGLSKFNLDCTPYECNITTSNTTSEGDYFHISYIMKNNSWIYLQQDILKTFNINIDFPALYFTRSYPISDGFKCGFDFEVFKSFNSHFYDECIETLKIFNSKINAVIFAGDFTEDGKFIDESINIEIIPFQQRETYFSIKNVLLENFDVEKIHGYDRFFEDYTIEKFCWHIKIKLSKDKKPIVKFYRTYPDNPFINYGNYK